MRTSALSQRAASARRTGATAVGTFAGAQLAIAIGALVRIPLTVRTIGLSAYGVIVLSTSMVVLMVIPIGAVRSTSRTLIAEHAGAQVDVRAVLQFVRRDAAAIAAAVFVFGLTAALLVPVGGLTSGGVSVGEIRCLLAFAVVSSSVALFGAAGWGELEAYEHVSVFNVHLLVITLVGLCLTVVAFATSAPFLVFGVIAVATSTVPYASVGITAARRKSRSRRGATSVTPVPSDAGAVVDAPNQAVLRTFARRSLVTFGARSTNEAMIRGLDPAIVALLVSAAAAGQFSVVQRLSQVSLVVPAALAPLVASRAALRRGRRVESLRGLARSVWGYALLGAAAGIGLLFAGQPLAELLIGAESGVDYGVLGLFGVLGVVWSADLALGLHLTGPESVKPMLKVTGLCAALNLVLSAVLTMAVGWTGPIWASIAALSVSLALMVVLVRTRPEIVTATFGRPA